MANITVTKQPNTLELAYGPNIISLYDLDEDGYKYVVRILDTDDNVIADFRQLPNILGYAHFDLQKALQSKVESNPSLEQITKLACSADELFQYNIQVGYYTDLSGSVVSELADDFVVINGRKRFDQIDWDKSEYVPAVTDFGGNVSVTSRQKALTDRHIKSTTGAAITDGKPITLNDAETVYLMNRFRSDDYTLTFLNDWVDNGAPAFFNGIGFVQVLAFNGNTALGTSNIDNTTANGGGPNVNTTDGIDPTGNFKTLTIQVGDALSFLAALPTCTHYYVMVQGYTTGAGVGQTELSNWYRFDITDGDCNDFDNVEVSWLNSFGFRDYFDFQKRNDHNIRTSQETYQKLNADWSAQTYSVPSYSRGERVYNSSIEDSYTVRTRYLDDAESTYLKNLYISPDVRVKMDGEWMPVIVTSNSWNERTFRKDRLFQHELTFKLANPQQIQHG